MTVATLLTVLNALGAVGSLTKTLFDIRADLLARPLDAPAPPESLAKVMAAMGSGGSVWDESHAPEGG